MKRLKKLKSKVQPLIWGRVPNPPKKRSKSWSKTDWAEWVIMFFFLIGAVVALGLVGALIMGLLEKLAIL